MLDALLENIGCRQYHQDLLAELKNSDQEIHELIAKEFERQQYCLQLIAAENQCSRAVLAALGSIVQNKTTEGFPLERFHAGCEFVDKIEQIAVTRACEAFGAEYANVQPHSGTAANQIALTAVLDSGDRILSLGLDQGGHLSHGADASFTGKFFEVQNYTVDRENFLLDYNAIGKRALQFKPKLIICGATAYSRTIDFGRFREIADSVGAYLLADATHEVSNTPVAPFSNLARKEQASRVSTGFISPVAPTFFCPKKTLPCPLTSSISPTRYRPRSIK